jgi:hypothetical protein
MKIHSLKLTLQDVETADKKKVAAIFGTVFIDNDQFKEDINGPVLDENGEKTPIYETINFTTLLSNVEHFKQIAQTMIIEALTLKNMEIAEENGTLSHFVRSIGAEHLIEKPTKGFRKTIDSIKSPKKKASKTIIAPRKKAK